MFISYQWDHQEEAIRVRQFLEEVTTSILHIWGSKIFTRKPVVFKMFCIQAGLSCWMDIGQMGGGDALYTRIYQVKIRIFMNANVENLKQTRITDWVACV